METKFAPSTQRAKLTPMCYCGQHNNKDGKCAPLADDPNKGYCHSCDKFFDSAEKKPYTPNLQPPKPTDYHPAEMLQKTFKNDKNKFVLFLKSIFESAIVDQNTKMYNVGSSKHWDGATIFWQVDDLQRVRYGKVMLYDHKSGKRVKEPFNHFTNIHTILKQKEFNHKQCLFGLHLLPTNKKPIAIVESEKTAIIMSLVDKEYLWLATGGKGNFKYEVLQPLAGKKVVAFPDVGETLWNEVSSRLNETGFNITISDKLENQGFPKGFDIADVVLQQIQEKKNPEKVNERKNAPVEVPELQRIKSSLSTETEELEKLARNLIPEYESRTERELLFSLSEIKGLGDQAGKDLILTMQVKQIIDYSKAGYYFLSNSSPF
ncbi:hypothetical protein SAMN05444360_102187 [Chryseobacterium carnipullorum]|uniref:DUF6371 domain-containing protein n=1 Tax=Chryseobacterium carnipullorum TaxID=1124835 RepID=UPI00091DB13A|nr:DUF6371 domain-containing protein [Chryseobacterium carnipullorum]SHL52574.1 hypothetical protein SAMN05444360_102187 [Chryseobacterium carnipullorum]